MALMLGRGPARQGDGTGVSNWGEEPTDFPRGMPARDVLLRSSMCVRFPLKLLEEGSTFTISFLPFVKERQLLIHPKSYYGAFSGCEGTLLSQTKIS